MEKVVHSIEASDNNQKTYPYLGTVDGGKVYFTNPSADQFDIEVIALALGNNCRYSGQVKKFYSVAEHCVLMAEYFANRGELLKAYSALMHDASEAYLTDIPRPMKPYLGEYFKIESKIQKCIRERFSVPEMCDDIKYLDLHIVGTEATQAFKVVPDWAADFDCIEGITLRFWDPETAGKNFLNAFRVLTKQLQINL